MAGSNIDQRLIDRIAKEVAERYDLSDEDLREVGRKLAEDREARQRDNEAFATSFMADHKGTFDRLAQS